MKTPTGCYEIFLHRRVWKIAVDVFFSVFTVVTNWESQNTGSFSDFIMRSVVQGRQTMELHTITWTEMSLSHSFKNPLFIQKVCYSESCFSSTKLSFLQRGWLASRLNVVILMLSYHSHCSVSGYRCANSQAKTREYQWIRN